MTFDHRQPYCCAKTLCFLWRYTVRSIYTLFNPFASYAYFVNNPSKFLLICYQFFNSKTIRLYTFEVFIFVRTLFKFEGGIVLVKPVKVVCCFFLSVVLSLSFLSSLGEAKSISNDTVSSVQLFNFIEPFGFLILTMIT